MEKGRAESNQMVGKGQMEKGKSWSGVGKGKPAGPKGPPPAQLAAVQPVNDHPKKADVNVDKTKQLSKDQQMEAVLHSVLKLLGGVPLPAELETVREGMKTFLITLNPGAAQKASVEQLAKLQKEREDQDKQLVIMRKVDLQKQKEYNNLVTKIAALEESRGKLSDQLREARKVIGGLDTDSEGDNMDACVYEQEKEEESESEDGSEDEGLAGAKQVQVTDYLRKSYGDLYGPNRNRGARQGPYREGGATAATQVIDEII